MASHRTNRFVWIFATVGFLIPFYWFGVMMDRFTAPESLSIETIRWAAVISCPGLLLQPYLNLDAWYLAPFLNAILYFLIAKLATATIHRRQRVA